MTTYYEVNFDGLIGPTHNYAGLSQGNVASQQNAHRRSHPREAALQGLRKMKMLMDEGYIQAFLPPQVRPRFDILSQLGFTGSEQRILAQVAKTAPQLLSMVYSASSMWTANAATVTPSPDSRDGKVHFTPANLLTVSHRCFEADHTYRLLSQVFRDPERFVVHRPLPAHQRFRDEGAANHTRFCAQYGARGHGLFVYGCREDAGLRPTRFPARQALMASEAVVRRHGMHANWVSYVQQHPDAIDGGAFHNDVVAVGNGPLLFYHDMAYAQETIQGCWERIRATVPEFHALAVPSRRVSLEDAIQTYVFNSQLLGQPDGSLESMTLMAPTECAEHRNVAAYLEEVVADARNPIQAVRYVNVRESMRNGGGPACLRLRVVLSTQELAAVHPTLLLSQERYDDLVGWVTRHYRDELAPEDLHDPDFLCEVRTSMDELSRMLDLNLG
jgi:succinylarginine dihydrolase